MSSYGGYTSCASCSDGGAYTSVWGGTAPYTYVWSNLSTASSINNVPAGTYSVCVTDANNCSVCDTVIVQLSTCTASFTSSQTAANTITYTNTSVNASTASHTWDFGDGNNSSSASPVHFYNVPGNYIVHLYEQDTLNNCLSTFSDTITVTGTLNCNLTNTPYSIPVSCASCADGFAQVNIFGGTAPYTVNWSSGETGISAYLLAAGQQTVTITDANFCSMTDTFTVAVSTCTGQMLVTQSWVNSVALFDVSTGAVANASQFWDFGDGFTGWYADSAFHTYTQPGIYVVQLFVLDSVNGCWGKASDTINVWGSSGSCLAYFSLIPDTSNPNLLYAVNQSSGSGAIQYLWNWGDSLTDTIAYPTHTYSLPGWYTITLNITDSLGCTAYYYYDMQVLRLSQQAASTPMTVMVIPGATSVPDHPKQSLELNPNPATEFLFVSGKNLPPLMMVRIMNLAGQLVKSETITDGRVDIRLLPEGLYFVELQAGNEILLREKVVVKK